MNQETKSGILYAASAYLLWGFLPIYWKLLDDTPPGEILAHRILWSFVLMIVIVLAIQKWKAFIQECKAIIRDKKKFIGITLASIAISLNWLTFIWAVNNDYVIQSSLGYYINPLVSILLGMIVLKETLTRRQLLSFILAGIGVINLTISYGVFPWVSLLLAFTFGIYGLLKKTVDISSIFGLTIETMIVTPIALIYLLAVSDSSIAADVMLSGTGLLLIGAGVATAVPLLLFASGAKQIPLSMVGFLQYIAPTIMLILGVFVYEETFSSAHLMSFVLIWTALIIYMASAQPRPAQRRKKN
ncbi:chloramphenicol-sensitive protein RarD [Lentibacillus halodurans]|uniref:Chloramphenicol-sensitive protein RarD n=1 Tax=Lentibacillus halodurans TaxID=237679 RepID=A0A1I0X840_9BACI|nr:EamA family transporter RarD [Lentibacillus halodurans]SFA97185.1 chloramphenicol-sensitive protein RarD [Lentibacillus halodurans]